MMGVVCVYDRPCVDSWMNACLSCCLAQYQQLAIIISLASSKSLSRLAYAPYVPIRFPAAGRYMKFASGFLHRLYSHISLTSYVKNFVSRNQSSYK